MAQNLASWPLVPAAIKRLRPAAGPGQPVLAFDRFDLGIIGQGWHAARQEAP